MNLVVTRASDPSITAEEIARLAAQVEAGEGCFYCSVRGILREGEELLGALKLCECEGSAACIARRELDALAAALRECEPGPTDCRRCLAARRRARRAWDPDEPGSGGGPCLVHATCAAHGGAVH